MNKRKSYNNSNKNKHKSISCFDIDPDDLDYNEDDKLIRCFDFRWPLMLRSAVCEVGLGGV